MAGKHMLSSHVHNTLGMQCVYNNFETVMTIVDEVSSDKTKVPDEFIFRSVLLDCFTAELHE